MRLEKYSIGTGDRFTKEAEAQLQAVMAAKEDGINLAIVWNKSYREHAIIHTDPVSVRQAADRAVSNLDWEGAYYVDADHINLETVDIFIETSDFFTLDVAAYIGRGASEQDKNSFFTLCRPYIGSLEIPGIPKPYSITQEILTDIASHYLYAVREAGKIYRYIKNKKGTENFITEVSMDETSTPQTPIELFFILAALADEGIPLQTIAPKFTGRFNKGVDYKGNISQFEKEFTEDISVIAYAVTQFGLPENLKLSVHSGSDKFSIYPVIQKALRKHDAGLHIKTAGTTWLEELIGLAEAGGEGLQIAKEIYKSAYGRYDELCRPYADVIDIDRAKLPLPDDVSTWSGKLFASALRHDKTDPRYNMHLRQLLHVGYKVAAEMGDRYLNALESCRTEISRNVTENLYVRHIVPLFGGLK